MSNEEETTSTASGRTLVEHVTIKVPQFMEKCVEGWFAVLEAQFELNRITVSSTKFYNALSHLPTNIICKLTKEILESKDYNLLKDSVTSTYERSKSEMFEELLSATKMSGKPSIFLQELQVLGSRIGVCEDLIRHKFVKGLPSHISPSIASHVDISLNKLGKIADDMLALCGQESSSTSSIFNVNNKTDGRSRSRERGSYSGSGSRSRSRETGNNPQRYESNNTDNQLPIGIRPYMVDQRPKTCRAHLYYGNKARTCKPWCQWPSKSQCKVTSNTRSSSPDSSENP